MFGRCNGLMFAPTSLAREIDEAFDTLAETAGRPVPAFAARTFPPMNIWEDQKAVYVEAELPGFRLADVEVTLTRQHLTIKGKRSSTTPEGANMLHSERRVDEFERTVSIRETLDHDHVAATMKDGLLLVTLPKSPTAQPRRITVNPSTN